MKMLSRLEIIAINHTLVGERICVKCRERKALTVEFFTFSKGYFRHDCKVCHSFASAEQIRTKYAESESFREHNNEYAHTYYREHRERRLEVARENRIKHKRERLSVRGVR